MPHPVKPVLCILPAQDYDPTESAVLWHSVTQAGYEVHFCTPSGQVAHADARLVTQGFGLLNPFLMTGKAELAHYAAMTLDTHFRQPLPYSAVDPAEYSALIIPGGHAQGMKTLLEAADAQRICLAFFLADKPLAAVCHGVLLAARTLDPTTGKSVLYHRKTTALPASMENAAWLITKLWLGDYYRTYPQSVQAEVTNALANPEQFFAGPLFSQRDSAKALAGFVVQDGRYLSARWPGDCYTLGQAFVKTLAA